MEYRRYTRIRERRESLGLKQENLARAVGISRKTLSDIERGVYLPRIDIALDIAKALKCPVGSLFPRKDGEEG